MFFLSFIFGTLIGSFLNVVILRLPAGEKLTGRSHCPNCKKGLEAKDLLPVLSFVFLLGRCGNCGGKISPRYPLIELFTGAMFAWAVYFFSPNDFYSWMLVAKVGMALCFLLVIFAIDWEHYLILDNVIIAGVLAMLLMNIILDAASPARFLFLTSLTVSAVVAAIISPMPFFALWYFSKGQWLGFGDVKLAIFLGMALGFPIVFVGIFLGIFIGGLCGIFLLITKLKGLKSQVPFGTFLSLGAAFSLFYGPFLLKWYLKIIGLLP